jgi:hypothetical protein
MRLPEQGVGGSKISTDARHVEWISRHQLELQYLRGACLSSCREMLRQFPELKLVRGHVATRAEMVYRANEDCEYLDPGNGHWWLETAGGEIVDPTAAQFECSNPFYLAFDESLAHELPTGKCPNCGFYAYNGKDFCSDDCAREYAAYCMREMRV